MRKALIALLLCFSLVLSVFADTAGPSGGSTFAQAADGNDSWTSLANLGAEDAATANCDLSNAGLSNTLQITGFGFSVSGTINGITVEIKRQGFGSTTAKDSSIRLLIGGVASGTDKASASSWPNASLQYATYGGAADTWGLSPTNTQINASDFGVAIVVQDPDLNAIARIDYVRITVTYTPAASGNPRGGDFFFSSPVSQTREAGRLGVAQ